MLVSSDPSKGREIMAAAEKFVEANGWRCGWSCFFERGQWWLRVLDNEPGDDAERTYSVVDAEWQPGNRNAPTWADTGLDFERI